jgi:hypothetical protein
MGWAEFLRPSPRKIALFAAVSLAFIPFMEYDNGIRCIRAPCPSSSRAPS